MSLMLLVLLVFLMLLVLLLLPVSTFPTPFCCCFVFLWAAFDFNVPLAT